MGDAKMSYSKARSLLRIALIFLAIIAAMPAVRADYSGSQRWFNGMSEEDRGLLQSRLMLLGHYLSLTDGTFGNYTYRAITGFQVSLGDAATGVLTSRQMDLLDAAAGELFFELGFDLVQDERGQMTLLLPQKLLPSISETKRGTAYASADGSMRLETIRKPYSEESFESLYRSLSSQNATRRISYQTLKSDSFVVSGTREGRSFYILIYYTPDESAGFSVEWDSTVNDLGAMVATFMASHSYPKAFDQPESNSPVLADAKPETEAQKDSARTRSASGSGFFVAERGVLVTNHHVVDGCSAIEVVGYGPARVVTSDKDVDLAVIQLRTPKPHPIAEIRGEAVELGESVVALGFPLADILNSSLNMGTGIISSETGLFGELTRFITNVGIQPGNSGGPILDENGRVLGVAVSKINDEALLAAIGTTAPNVGFAIKGDVVADYLSIFRLPEPSADPEKPLTSKELADKGRNFTVQILCDA